MHTNPNELCDMSTTRIQTSWRFQFSSRRLNGGFAPVILFASLLGCVSCAMIPSATLRIAHDVELHSFYRNAGRFANTDTNGPEYIRADKSFVLSDTAPECTSSVRFSAKHDHSARPWVLSDMNARRPRPPKLSRTIELN